MRALGCPRRQMFVRAAALMRVARLARSKHWSHHGSKLAPPRPVVRWRPVSTGQRKVLQQQKGKGLLTYFTYFLPPLLSTEHKALSHADADWDHSVYCTRGIVPPEPDPPPLAVGRPRWIITMTIRIRASNGFRQVCLYTLQSVPPIKKVLH